jgi:hypothetical protein
MPENPFRKLARESRKRTNNKLATELARLTPLTEEDLKQLLPTKQDKENLAELMAIVKSATSENRKVAELGRNIDRLGAVAVRLLDAFV